MGNHIVLRWFLVLFCVPCALSYNILVMFPHPGKSHFDSYVGLFKALARKGHRVTVISYFPLKEPIPNYRDIEIGGIETFKSVTETNFHNLTELETHGRKTKYFTSVVLAEMGQLACENGFRSKNVQSFLKEKNHFDIAIVEYFNSDCFLTVAKKFGVPVVRVHSCTLMPWTSNRYGDPDHSAYIPNNFMPFSNKMNFFERVENTLLNVIHSSYYNNFAIVNRDRSVSMKYFGDLGASIHSDVLNDSLLLVASHYTVNLPRPLVPGIVEVGGIHIGTKSNLPKDIQKWIDESTHGVIYFSFGSLVKGSTMPAEKRQAFINAFRRLPQRVIWKWENDTMEGKSDNIMIGKWLPQLDILSHPNVKAFISHGGLLGTFEAVHCGVPILVMPQFGDQHTNAKAIESVGGGEVLYLSDATEEKIYTVLKKLLTPSFQQQAKELSERFRDRPMPPLETAIYWVEYVARHKGAHFMKTAAVGMPFYQYYLLDVIAFVLTVLLIFFYILFLILRTLVRLLRRSKVSSEKMKQS